MRRMETRETQIVRRARITTQEGERKMIHGKETESLSFPFPMIVMDSLYLIFERVNH
jgi:hypothetical protein